METVELKVPSVVIDTGRFILKSATSIIDYTMINLANIPPFVSLVGAALVGAAAVHVYHMWKHSSLKKRVTHRLQNGNHNKTHDILEPNPPSEPDPESIAKRVVRKMVKLHKHREEATAASEKKRLHTL